MRLSSTSSPSWRNVFVSTLVFSSSCTNWAWAKKDAPSIKSTPFDFLPVDLNYFDDSDVIIFADAHKLDMWRSEDAGETWAIADGVPKDKLFEMIMHPFDPKRAYYVTYGTEHWSTSDRGKTWQSFKTSAKPSRSRTAMTFHAKDPDRVIFNAEECEGVWFCTETVGCLALVLGTKLTWIDIVHDRSLQNDESPSS